MDVWEDKEKEDKTMLRELEQNAVRKIKGL